MNKTFKTLFTLFLGILFFIPTFTANSVESLGEQLIKLEGLYERGTITKEEFSKAKTILLKMDVDSSEKIEKAKKKIVEKKRVEKAALVTNLESEVNQKKSYPITEVRRYASSAKDKWEKTEFFFDDYRIYAHRGGAIKIRRISDGKQLAVLTKNFKIKYYNGGEDLFDTKTYKENTLEKNKPALLTQLLPVTAEINKITKALEKSLDKVRGKKKLPGKMILQFNGATILTWERMYVAAHNANFYQMLALNDQPFHFYVVHPKGEFALNMAKFVKKIDIAVAEVKERLAKEYDLTPEEMDKILKQRKDNLDRQLASISKETGEAIELEAGKAIESEVGREVATAVDAELAKELESVIGAESAKEIAAALDEALGAELIAAVEQEMGKSMEAEIQSWVADAVAEGISAATAEAAIKAGIEVLNQGGTIEQAVDVCKSAGGGAAC